MRIKIWSLILGCFLVGSLLIMAGCSAEEEVQAEKNIISLEAEQDGEDPPEFDYQFRNMLHSIIQAQLLLEEYFDLPSEEKGDELYQELQSAINRAERSITDFGEILDQIEEEETAWYKWHNIWSPSVAYAGEVMVALHDDPQDLEGRMMPAVEGDFELSREQKELYAARAFRNSARGERIDALRRAQVYYGISMADAREASVDYADDRRKYHEGQIESLDQAYRAAKYAERTGDVALFALDVSTPMPLTAGARALRYGVIGLRGVDTALAVGEVPMIMMGNEEGQAAMGASREALETPLRIFAYHDLVSQGTTAITDLNSLPGTLSHAAGETQKFSNYMEANVTNMENILIEHHYIDADEYFLSKEEIEEKARELRKKLLNENEEKLAELDSWAEEMGLDIVEEAIAGIYEGEMSSNVEGHYMSYPIEIEIDEDNGVYMSYEDSMTQSVAQMVPDGAAGGEAAMIHIEGEGSVSGSIDPSTNIITASGSGSSSYSVEGYSGSHTITYEMEAELVEDTIIGTIESVVDTGDRQNIDFEAVYSQGD